MPNYHIVDTETGNVVRRNILLKKVRFTPTVTRYNVAPGMSYGTLRIVEEYLGKPTGNGTAIRVVDESWNGADKWEVTHEYYTPEPPPEAPDETRARLTAFIQRRLDVFAQERGYDGILSLCSYDNSTDPTFAAEAAIGIAKRDAAWRTAYELLAEAQAGTRPVPTVDKLLTLLPALTWPGEQGDT